MKIWLVHDLDHGGVSAWHESVDPADIPLIKTELSYLEGGYEEERDDFLDDLNRAYSKGRGSASIVERVRVELVEVGGLHD